MAVLQLDHVGILVTDLDAAVQFYRDVLGLEPGPIETRDEPPIRRVCIPVGNVELELIEARDPDQTMARVLPYRGPGVYHLALRVADVDAEADRLAARGVPLVGGRQEGDRMRVQFLDPAAAQGTLIELVTRGEPKG